MTQYENALAQRKLAESRLWIDCLGEIRAVTDGGRASNATIDSLIDHYAKQGMPNVDRMREKAEKIRTIARMRAGNLPVLDRPRITVAAGETAHLEFGGVQLYENRVVSREWVDQSAGVTIFDGPFAFSLGENRGKLVDRVGPVKLGDGRVILTSHRLIFASSTAGLNIPWIEIVSLTAGRSGISVVSGFGAKTAAPVFLACNDPEFVCDCADAIREGAGRAGTHAIDSRVR